MFDFDSFVILSVNESSRFAVADQKVIFWWKIDASDGVLVGLGSGFLLMRCLCWFVSGFVRGQVLVGLNSIVVDQGT